jgi:hypothetical protein
MTTVDPATVEALRAKARADSVALPNTTYLSSRPPVARCRSCHRPIWWGQTAAGKRCPFNYDLVTATATNESHFRTCPQAAQHSRRTPPASAELPWSA